MKVYLNGNEYELSGGVQRDMVAEWPQQIRTTGLRTRQDRELISVYAKEDFSGGHGVKRILPGVDTNRFWDSSMETRFQEGAVAPYRVDLNTRIPKNNVRAGSWYFTLNDQLFCHTAGSLAQHVVTRWEFLGLVDSAQLASYGLSLGTYATGLFLTGGEYDNGVNLFYWNGATSLLHKVTLQSIPSQVVATTVGTAFARPTSVAYDRGSSGYAKLRISTPSHSQLPNPLVFSVTIGTNASIISSSHEYNFGNDLVTACFTRELVGTNYPVSIEDGIMYHLDNGVVRKLYDFSQFGSDIGVGACSWRNKMYIPIPNGRVLEVDSNGNYTDISPLVDDGYPANRSGPYTASVRSAQWLFLARAGNSSRIRNIVAYDGVSWHTITLEGVGAYAAPQLYISRNIASAGNIERLHYASAPTYGIDPWGGAVAPTLSSDNQERHIPNILTSPSNVPSMIFGGGWLEDGEFDGYLPEAPAGFYRFYVNARGLNASKYVTVYYGLNGEAATTNILGTIATQGWLNFGTYGVSGRSISTRVNITTNLDATAPDMATYPQILGTFLEYLKQPTPRESFTLNIDVLKTARIGARGEETILDELNTARNLTTLVPFWYGKIGTRTVKVLPPQSSQEDIGEQVKGSRKSVVQVRLVEMLT